MKNNQAAFIKLCLADALISLMRERPYAEIGVSDVCERSGLGRTTFYRHCDCKGSMDGLLIFKLEYEWERYRRLHGEEPGRGCGCALLECIYENREQALLMYRNGLYDALRRAYERMSEAEGGEAGADAYLRSFYTYGRFGVLCRWIEDGFDKTPGQVCGIIGAAAGGCAPEGALRADTGRTEEA